jgi:GTPase
MHFVDECEFQVEAGKGGDGCAAFRREKFLPLGGPAGGDGGRGGSVIFVADSGLGTLSDLSHQTSYKAQSGEPGQGRDCYGRSAKDLEIRVPLGTIVFDRDSRQKLGELLTADSRLVVAQGGRGGRGNKHFVTSVDRAPRRADPGQPGEARALRLELSVMADVGLLGMPNVGKSTFISTVTRAYSKVADYPFTTLEPHLGVVRVGDWQSGLGKSFVIADIPGLVPGAAEGRGLGSRFLRHVQRTRVLVHLLTALPGTECDPFADYLALRRELELFDTALAQRPELVVLTKCDLPEVAALHADLAERFQHEQGKILYALSSVAQKGVRELLVAIAQLLDSTKASSNAELPGAESPNAESPNTASAVESASATPDTAPSGEA